MIYVVSGHPRSGTSMLMAALEAGGMPVVFDRTRDERFNWLERTGYQPNRGGLFEVEPAGTLVHGWPRAHDGKAIKVLTPWLKNLHVHEYKVVFMRRDAEEIRQSYEGAFRIKVSRDRVEREVEEALRSLRNRRDVERIYELQYTDALSNRAGIFEHLRDIEGWPIRDTCAAGDVVDSSQWRYRREQLTEGL